MSKPKFFRKVFDGDEKTRRLQTDIEQAVGSAIRSPLLNGRMVSDVDLASGSTTLEHKLAREIRGYLIVKRSNASTIYDESSDDKFLTLNASGAVTVSLWIF